MGWEEGEKDEEGKKSAEREAGWLTSACDCPCAGCHTPNRTKSPRALELDSVSVRLHFRRRLKLLPQHTPHNHAPVLIYLSRPPPWALRPRLGNLPDQVSLSLLPSSLPVLLNQAPWDRSCRSLSWLPQPPTHGCPPGHCLLPLTPIPPTQSSSHADSTAQTFQPLPPRFPCPGLAPFDSCLHDLTSLPSVLPASPLASLTTTISLAPEGAERVREVRLQPQGQVLLQLLQALVAPGAPSPGKALPSSS